MRCGILMLILGISFGAHAFCPFSDALLKTLNGEAAISLYKNCAERMNDDNAQAYLAKIYDQGSPSIPRNLKKALYYYQLSADNGNAESQARLAQLYMQLDKDKQGRAELHNYMKNIVAFPTGENEFQGELIHPYVLLTLANEKPENKWFYPTKVKKAPTYATNLHKNYKLTEEKKKQLMHQAVAWKKRKLLEIAQQLLPEKEYLAFKTALYPPNGQVDAFKRKQLMEQFQERVKKQQEQDQENAKAFY